MTIPMPDPVAIAFLAECGNVAYTGHLEGPYKRLSELSVDGRRGASLDLITTEQAEAYKNDCVREALEEAAQACEARIGQHAPGMTPEDVEDCDEEARLCAGVIRALMGSHDG